jgi:Tfp pilus assembly protein PilO
MSSVKEEAKKLIDRLPDQVTWDDIMYEFYVKKKIATGSKAVEEGRTIPQEEVKKKFLYGLPVS